MGKLSVGTDHIPPVCGFSTQRVWGWPALEKAAQGWRWCKPSVRPPTTNHSPCHSPMAKDCNAGQLAQDTDSNDTLAGCANTEEWCAKYAKTIQPTEDARCRIFISLRTG